MLTMKRTEHTNRNICVYIKISALLIYARTHTVTNTDTDTNAQLQIHFDQQGREQCVSCPGIRLNKKKAGHTSGHSQMIVRSAWHSDYSIKLATQGVCVNVCVCVWAWSMHVSDLT